MKRATVSVRKVSHPRYKFRVTYLQGDDYLQRYFKTKQDAGNFAHEKKIELLNEGRKHGEWSDDERRAVIEAREIGEKLTASGIAGFSLRLAVKHYADHLQQLRQSATVERAIDELLELREAEGKTTSHLRDLKYRLKKFETDFEGRLMASVGSKEISEWLLGLKCASQTRLNYKRILGNLFSFSVGRGYAKVNPVTSALNIKVPSTGRIGILSVVQARRLLSACSAEILPAVAIGMFAGLRREEIARLDWSEVNLQRGFIEVKASKAKTAQRRLVSISENLRKWLASYLLISGPVRPSEMIYRDRLNDAAAGAGIVPWPHNALRHSFASYHLAMHEDAAKTALLLGHAESGTLFRHYRELVRQDDASAYWAILPEDGAPANVMPLREVA